MEWPELLEEMEARVAELLRGAAEAKPPKPWVFPPEMGPIPDQLRSRAEAILGATQAAEVRIEEARSRLAEAIGRHEGGRGSPSPPRPAPAYVDKTA